MFGTSQIIRVGLLEIGLLREGVCGQYAMVARYTSVVVCLQCLGEVCSKMCCRVL